jgi:hypothetical protein
LHEHPEELDAFLDFHHLQLHKLTMPIAEIFGSGTIPEKALADIKTEFEKVKKQFMVTDCKKCGTEKLNHTWSKLNFVAMAKKTEHFRCATGTRPWCHFVTAGRGRLEECHSFRPHRDARLTKL